MPYILEHLTSLRQEITDLRNMNARSASRTTDSQIDQSAVEMRANRLLEIKKELSQMLNRPDDPAVWWEKGGRPNPRGEAGRIKVSRFLFPVSKCLVNQKTGTPKLYLPPRNSGPD